MEIDNLLPVTTRQELRAWLQENSTTQKYCWVIVSVKPEPNKIQYLDAVEEALCFGWIDGIKKKASETQTAQRLSPRGPKSSWTELNKERVRRLERLGQMTEQGRKVLPNMAPASFKIDEEVEMRLKEEAIVYQNFLAFPELYRRIRIDTLQGYKEVQPEIFEKRLTKLIENTRANRMYGAWHDEGRLLE
ncbi:MULTISPECIES: YdeI/OmpD-associated family protein [unclassified Enterococcus]|uniref:YdeI/OmpD-associated family protein n=1 Tax=unclassified Enterococcus TaxID=2608891 RepID=UPI001CE08E73|nr:MULTISPECIES: YdeI/OmpD-associated family protein [unclassified Enterococcus]MCA5013678.1 YdeI/OmpD-associated family protein [Enterococcus sp. S23]MCA5016928.1 YdeI/OmpD-associated family protein [Enterococcus sp. S22(2020)]